MKKSLTAFLIIAVIMIFSGCKKEEVYRLVKVNHFDGTVTIEREEKMDAFEGLQLISEDTVETGESSTVELLADSDKHILAEEKTKFTIEATGTEKSGNIKINLLYGTSLIEIENKLSEDDYFSVQTPNATIAVRGTTFKVAYDEETETTSVEVVEGVVAVTTDEKTEELTAGKTAVVDADEIVIEEKPKGPRTERREYENDGYAIVEYDENDNMIKYSYYNEDDTLGYYELYEYDSEGNRIKYGSYKSDGKVDIFEYDSNGNMIKYNNYKRDGTLYNYYTYEYDSNGYKTRENVYNSDGEFSRYYTFEYDSNDNILKKNQYKSDGTFIFYYTYEYDSDGNKIKENYYSADGTIISSGTY